MSTVEPVADEPGFGPEEQSALLGKIGNLVAHFCPADWVQVMITYRAAGDYTEMPVMVRRATDGGLELWTPRPEVAALFAELRAKMYQPGRGTWYSVTAHVFLNSRVESRFLWDDQPDWDGEPPVSALLRELTDFPRDEPMVPDWLRERVGKTAAATLSGYADPEAAVKEALSTAEQAAAELEADPANYRVGEVADNAWCLVPEAGRWSVFWAHGGEKLELTEFGTARDALRQFVGNLYLNRAAFTGALAPDAKRETRAWPIQPMGDDLGLSLYQGKRLVTLPPGTEFDRYGDPAGNTLFAARTEFTHRSQPAEWAQRDYHVYRLRRAVRALVGTAVAWHDGAGGGTAYVLERSVADLLAEGALEEVPNATTLPPTGNG
jgi:hypothetical protein